MVVEMELTEAAKARYDFTSVQDGNSVLDAFKSGEDIVLHFPAPEEPDDTVGWVCESFIGMKSLYFNGVTYSLGCAPLGLMTYNYIPLAINVCEFDEAADKIICSVALPK